MALTRLAALGDPLRGERCSVSINRVGGGGLCLPEPQRGKVWKPSQYRRRAEGPGSFKRETWVKLREKG
jgi:hypothetical protein